MTLQFVFKSKQGKLARKVIFALVCFVFFNFSACLKGQTAKVSPNVYKNTLNMVFRRIEPGSFLIGSKSNGDLPAKVNITKPFYIGVFEVTQSQYLSLTEKNPSNMKNDDFPVNMVSWVDAQRFCRLLSRKERQLYRLPTNAEWEYCCRAGTVTDFYWGSDKIEDYCWYKKNSFDSIHKVGEKKPNAWNLFDMNGNVSELCLDGYEVYYGKEQTDPKNKMLGFETGIIRGGDWSSSERFCNSYFRLSTSILRKSPFCGFRVVLEIP